MDGLLIKNVIIADGDGKTPFPGAVQVTGDRITAVFAAGDGRPPPRRPGDIVFDGDGRYMLSPGFIDPHGHSDISLVAAPDAYGKISQGITTETGGNCGLSCFPLNELNREHLKRLYASYGIAPEWNSLREYAEKLSRSRPAINFMPLCGYNTLRAAAAGYDKIKPSPALNTAIGRLLRASLRQGAAGLSSGMIYIPGKFADTNEITAALRVLREFGRPYTTHLRSEGDRLLESLLEAIECSLAAGIPRLHISHFKTSGQANWNKLAAALEMIGKAAEKGLMITVDRYPYIESMTQLSVILPPPFDDMDDVKIQELLRRPDERNKLNATLSEMKPERWHTVRMVDTAAPGREPMRGMTLAEIAAVTGTPPWKIVTELLAADAPGTTAAFQGMNRENMLRILSLPFAMCATDESARPAGYHLGRSHPRGFGSFPEFFRCLTAKLPPGEIIRKMTSLPAEIFGLRDRGRIAPGYAADLVMFDPDSFSATADFADPHRPAKGIHAVFVNGKLSFTEGTVTGHHGKVLLF